MNFVQIACGRSNLKEESFAQNEYIYNSEVVIEKPNNMGMPTIEPEYIAIDDGTYFNPEVAVKNDPLAEISSTHTEEIKCNEPQLQQVHRIEFMLMQKPQLSAESRMMSNINVRNVCRTCMKDNVPTTKINETVVNFDGQSATVSQMLTILGDVEIIDGLPNLICMDCVKSVADIFMFKIQYEKSVKYLKEYLVQCLLQNSTESEVQKPAIDVPLKCIDHRVHVVDGTNHNDDILVTSQKRTKKRKKCNVRTTMQLYEEDSTSLVCKICDESYETNFLLKVHQRHHQNKGEFLCIYCGQGFDSPKLLKQHRRVHHGNPLYACYVCLKNFPSAKDLKLHWLTNNGEQRPLACSQCKSKFISERDLKRHEAIHTEAKLHVCSVCKREFKRKINLDYHYTASHTKERPFKCSACDKGFVRKTYLEHHIMEKHS